MGMPGAKYMSPAKREMLENKTRFCYVRWKSSASVPRSQISEFVLAKQKSISDK